ncbi:MAG: CAP domain-containing protein [Candidatus Paceibacteria bacterium]
MEQIPESRKDKFYRLSVRLQKTALLAMSFLVILSFMMTNLLALLWQSSDWLVGAVLPGVVATLTNAEREKYAVAPLSRSATLDAAAKMKAEHMAAEEYFAHDSPGGITPWYWFERAGYVYAHAGENLAIHFQDSDEVVKAWMNSPTHKANVIGAQYTEIGIGTAKGKYRGHPTVFVVQLFGTPAKRPVVVAPPPAEPVTVPEVTPSSSLEVATGGSLAIAQTNEEVTTDTYTEVNVPVTRVSDESSAPITPVLEENYGSDVEVGVVEGSFASTLTPFSPETEDVLPASFMATSSGLIPYLEGREFVAGTTAPVISSLATKPRTVLQGIYMLIGSVVIVLLITSVILGYRTHQRRTVATGVGLLVLMSLLFVWHIAITAGAVVV